ncbi:hypothetical protein DQ04_14791000, partial [Trypanosoma grayi]|uniref:hypothetical protein n=1 Tax=Trypanosoma grayi TaxID=71804 RepID=UPI0004F45A53
MLCSHKRLQALKNISIERRNAQQTTRGITHTRTHTSSTQQATAHCVTPQSYNASTPLTERFTPSPFSSATPQAVCMWGTAYRAHQPPAAQPLPSQPQHAAHRHGETGRQLHSHRQRPPRQRSP